VFLSTTAFHAMPLGRLWKRRFDVPFVLDMQDPWVNDYAGPKRAGAKHGLARRLHAALEPWTMRAVDGIVAVSDSYHVTLRRRYPRVTEDRCLTLPFAAAERDFEVARRTAWRNPFFSRGDGLIHGCYAGALGPAMRHACTAICRALRIGLDRWPDLFGPVRLHFVGTDYASGGDAKETIRPIAAEHGLEPVVFEQPQRVPYFAALNLLLDADFLLVPGSDDPGYTASKIYPYILARKPLLALFHEESSAARVLDETRAGDAVTFRGSDDIGRLAERLATSWRSLLARLPFTPPTDWDAFRPYTAREMTARLCGLFERVAGRSPRPAPETRPPGRPGREVTG
jgi:hypothetical protein